MPPVHFAVPLIPAAAPVPAGKPPALSGIHSLPPAAATVLRTPLQTIEAFLGLLPLNHQVPIDGALRTCMRLLQKKGDPHVGDHTKWKVCAVLSAIEKNGGVAAFGGCISRDFLAAFFFLLTSGAKALKKREKSPEFCAACDTLVSAPFREQVWYVFWYMCEDICPTFHEWYIHSYGRVLASADDLKNNRQTAMESILTHFQSP
jgi:hypothetical protein